MTRTTYAADLDADFAALATREAAATAQPKPGQGRWTTTPGGHQAKIGRYPDGRYYADICYRVDEGYDDDFGSRTCLVKCPQAGSAHVHFHRVGLTWADVAAAATRPHSAASSLQA